MSDVHLGLVATTHITVGRQDKDGEISLPLSEGLDGPCLHWCKD